MDPTLTPGQKRVVERIFAFDVARPVFDEGIAERLRGALEEGVSGSASTLAPDAWIKVDKYRLDRVHRCAGLFAASEGGDFVWTVPMLRGRVAHRAIEVAIAHPGAGAPLELIDRSIAALIAGEEQASVATFLADLPALDMARLKAEANEAVAGFLMGWPVIDRRWTPRVESPVRVRLAGGRVRLQGKYDLAFGKPNGMEARVIIVDFKTGDRRANHVEDLRFYALMETIRSGVPPFRVASYYVEEGDFQTEDVMEDALMAAVRRTVDGVRLMIAAGSGPPSLSPGPHCRFCPAKGECRPGMDYLVSAEAKDGF